MSYKYETHLHTSVSSACGRSRGSEYIAGYKAMGYDGIFVTDHFYLGNTCVPRELPWRDWVHRYTDAWREARAEGDRQGLKVFFGWETTYGSGEDFLIYGLSPEWLETHPDIITLRQEEQYALVHAEGGLVVQAHPFRERDYMTEIVLHPNHCDAWEIANAGNEAYQDLNAYEFALKRGMIMTCGSDIHTAEDQTEEKLFAMVTEEPINCEADYVKQIMSGTGFSMNFPEKRMKCERKAPYFEVFLKE